MKFYFDNYLLFLGFNFSLSYWLIKGVSWLRTMIGLDWLIRSNKLRRTTKYIQLRLLIYVKK